MTTQQRRDIHPDDDAGQKPGENHAPNTPERDLPEESDTAGKKGQLSEGALPRARTSSPEDLADVAVNEAEPMPSDDHPGEVD